MKNYQSHLLQHICQLNMFQKILINQKSLKKVKSINSFFIKNLKKKPKIAVLGLNPHCETIEKIGEEKKEIIPAINKLKSEKLNINRTFFCRYFFYQKKY